MPNCKIQIGREILKADIIVMPIEDFDLILGMDWLLRHTARVDCNSKIVQFVRPEWDVMEFKGNRTKKQKFLIAETKAQKILEKGSQYYLAYLLNKPKDQCILEDTIVVKEFPEVFPKDPLSDGSN
jgi:hypothetical protein